LTITNNRFGSAAIPYVVRNMIGLLSDIYASSFLWLHFSLFSAMMMLVDQKEGRTFCKRTSSLLNMSNTSQEFFWKTSLHLK